MHVWCVAVKREAIVRSMLWGLSSNRPRKPSMSSWSLTGGSSKKNTLIYGRFAFVLDVIIVYMKHPTSLWLKRKLISLLAWVCSVLNTVVYTETVNRTGRKCLLLFFFVEYKTCILFFTNLGFFCRWLRQQVWPICWSKKAPTPSLHPLTMPLITSVKRNLLCSKVGTLLKWRHIHILLCIHWDTLRYVICVFPFAVIVRWSECSENHFAVPLQ